MKTLNYKFEKGIPVIATVEVLVIGGGPGGICASVMAARQGVSVLLAERYGALGGMASFGEVLSFMANHLNSVPLDKPLYGEWVRKMREYLPEAQRNREFDDNLTAPAQRQISKDLAMLGAEDLCLEAGVRLLYHHNLIDVIMENRKIIAAVFASKSGLVAVKSEIFIDATGDGDLAALASCGYEFGNEEGYCQPMTLCFKLGGVELDRIPDCQFINRLYEQAKAAGEIDCVRENVLWSPVNEKGVIHFNTTRVVKKSGLNGIELSEAEIDARRQIREYLRFLRRRVAGFEDARIHSIAHQIGIRETRRVIGEIRQTVNDFTEARHYPDGIAKVNYPIDIHNPSGSGTVITAMPKGKWYEISYRAIVPINSNNLLMGCRAVSLDHALHSSARIMPVVCSIGQAAGMAAAIAVKSGKPPAAVDGVELRSRLVAVGADL